MRRVRAGLMAFEIAGALVLMEGCGLMVRSVVQMLSTDLGFEAEGLRASRIMLRARNYPDAAAFRRFHERFADSLAVTTGSPVAFSNWPPFVPPPTPPVLDPPVVPAPSPATAPDPPKLPVPPVVPPLTPALPCARSGDAVPQPIRSATHAQRMIPSFTKASDNRRYL